MQVVVGVSAGRVPARLRCSGREAFDADLAGQSGVGMPCGAQGGWLRHGVDDSALYAGCGQRQRF